MRLGSSAAFFLGPVFLPQRSWDRQSKNGLAAVLQLVGFWLPDGLVWPLWPSVHWLVVGHELKMWQHLDCLSLLATPSAPCSGPAWTWLSQGQGIYHLACLAVLSTPCLLLECFYLMVCAAYPSVSNPLSRCCHSPLLAGVISLIPSHWLL